MLGVITLITCACSSQGNVVEDLPAPTPDPLAQAELHLAHGDYAAAATAYVSYAAKLSTADASHVRAQAALAFQDAGDYGRADELLATIKAAGATGDLLAVLVAARALLHGGHPTDALAVASRLEGAAFTLYQQGVRARVIGAAANATNHFAIAAPAWVAAFHLPFPLGEQAAMVQATWSAVAHLPAGTLAEQLAATAADPSANGWYSLAALAAQTAYDQAALVHKIADWKQRHPGHPAVVLLDGLLERSAAATVQPRRIALILPFEDTLGVAARAVRDGFITAWYRDPNTAARPALSIYANTGDNILQDYQQAVGAGAEFVIGPLQKNLVERLKVMPELPVGVLALNAVDNKAGTTPPAGFYQFGLNPEDEADQVARRAFGEGPRALVIAPNSAWGARLMAAYSASWQQLGGSVLAQVAYAESADAYAGAIRRALNIDMSEARAAALRNRLGLPLHAEARHRSDVSVILLAGFPDNARQLLPQLRYFGADNIPIFATSHVFAGATDAARDLDLNGLIFGDMPWLFGAADGESMQLVRRSWPGPASNFARLYAFGIDAYRLLPYLARMRSHQSLRVPGVTGDLSMSSDGIVHRNMMWMKFVDGIPTALGATSGSADVN